MKVYQKLCLTGRPEVEGTAEFADIFDKYLDILNVSNFDNGRRKRKRFQEPYRDASDFRLKVYKYVLKCIIIIHTEVYNSYVIV